MIHHLFVLIEVQVYQQI